MNYLVAYAAIGLCICALAAAKVDSEKYPLGVLLFGQIIVTFFWPICIVAALVIVIRTKTIVKK